MKNYYDILGALIIYLESSGNCRTITKVPGRTIYLLNDFDKVVKELYEELKLLYLLHSSIKDKNFPNYFDNIIQLNIQYNTAYNKSGPFHVVTEKEKIKENIFSLEKILQKHKNPNFHKEIKLLEKHLSLLYRFKDEEYFILRKPKSDYRALAYVNVNKKTRLSLRIAGNIFVGEKIKLNFSKSRMRKTRSDKLYPLFEFNDFSYYKYSDFKK